MFSYVIDVLELIIEDGEKPDQRAEARMLLDAIVSYDFVFAMHLMRTILAITNELSLALQRKEQDIDNAMRLVQISKQRLQTMRDDGWNSLLIRVSRFCDTHDLAVMDMNDQFVAPGRPRRKRTSGKSNMDHFRTDLFYAILDKQLMELNSRFSEAGSELLRYVGCLNPKDSFYSFDKERLISLAQLYPLDFSEHDISIFGDQLETFIVDMRTSSEFSALYGISCLAKKMVEKRRHIIYHLVYKLITLALTLPVATPSVERAFSVMKIIKNRLRNRMLDDWLEACLVTYIEKDVFNGVENEAIMQRFQAMRPRREQL